MSRGTICLPFLNLYYPLSRFELIHKSLKIKKGLRLELKGGVEPGMQYKNIDARLVAMTPDDFPGMIPKLEKKEGEKVVKGEALWHDKTDELLKVVSPVNGTIKEIVRGEKRKLLRVTIEVSEESVDLPKNPSVIAGDRKKICERIREAGLWTMIRRLPFDIVPSSTSVPRDIFITAWDAAPLASGMKECRERFGIENLQAGVDALKKITDGKVYIGFDSKESFPELNDAEEVAIEGDYPASLPSVLAANISPVNKGETVWLTDIVTVGRIGQAVQGKEVDWSFPVAVTGSEVNTPCNVWAPAGVKISELLAVSGLKHEDDDRVISGNVFTGINVGKDGYLRYPYRQVTVIPEGAHRDEFMGWASMNPSKISVNRSFPSFFLRKKKFSPDARLNGGRRSMIMSGEYDKVLPMDIMGEYLIKAILSRDIEKMENLGIYEVTPADFSAAEFVDTSKLELQKIVREGLDYMIKEIGKGE